MTLNWFARDVRASVGAGFLFPLVGTMTTMPGLPTRLYSTLCSVQCILSNISYNISVANSPNPRPKMIKQPESNSFGPREIVGLIMGRMVLFGPYRCKTARIHIGGALRGNQ